LTKRSVVAALRPVFSTSVLRNLYHLGAADWDIDVALDQGEVGAGERHEPICEIELKLTRGAPRHLFTVANKVLAAVPDARLLTLAKSDRGYQLASGAPPLPTKAGNARIAVTMTVAGAFQAIARNCLDHLLANERCLVATRNAEALHQMRVALRRLRSAMKVFRRTVAGPDLDAARTDLRWLLGILGPARDDYVFLADIIEPVIAAHPETGPLAALRAEWAEQAERNATAALSAIGGTRYTGLLLALAAWVEDGAWLGRPDNTLRGGVIGPYARRILSRQHTRLLNTGGDDLTALAPADLHQVRIFGKQVRYAAEFFAPLYPARTTDPFLDILNRLQDTLGQLNDIAVAGARLAAGQSDDGRAWAAGLVAGWHAGRRPALLAKAAKLWRRYRKARPFWEDRSKR
jgi:inorganic triphosphatase YgiF